MKEIIKKTAVLIQAHKESQYIKKLALANPDVNFYIHFDIKSNIATSDYTAITNIFLLSERMDVKWGGFSQVKATLNLFSEAIKNEENAYFHLISGEDICLSSFQSISNEIGLFEPKIYMDFNYSSKHQYRIRFFAIHSDTFWQRSLIGKILTKLNAVADKVLPLNSKKKIFIQYMVVLGFR